MGKFFIIQHSLLTLIILNLVIIFLIFSLTSPLSLSGGLLLTAFFTAVLLGVNFSSWFLYFLTLVFLGGVIVIVLFLCSICSNKKILSLNFSLNIPILLLISTIFDLFYLKTIFIKNSLCSPIILSLYQANSARILIFLIRGLILCLIRVVIITNLDRGPLLASIYLSSLRKNRRVWIFRYKFVLNKNFTYSFDFRLF